MQLIIYSNGTQDKNLITLLTLHGFLVKVVICSLRYIMKRDFFARVRSCILFAYTQYNLLIDCYEWASFVALLSRFLIFMVSPFFESTMPPICSNSPYSCVIVCLGIS